MNARNYYFLVLLVAAAIGETCPADEPTTAEQRDLAVGDVMPAIVSNDDEGRPWKLVEHLGEKALVLYFYPGDFTGGCIKQAEKFREGLAKLEERGVKLIGVSGDEVATHKLFKETYDLKHTLLADTKGDLARALGVPVSRGRKVRPKDRDGKTLALPMLRSDGTLLPGAETSLFVRPVTLARWTFVVRGDGKIASVRRDVNPVTDAQEVLEIVDALAK